MKKLVLAALAVLLSALAGPALAMGTPPTVTAPPVAEAIPIAEYNAVAATQARVSKAYDRASMEVKRQIAADVDRISTQTAAAQQAQKLGNRDAFNAHRDEVNRVAASVCARIPGGC